VLVDFHFTGLFNRFFSTGAIAFMKKRRIAILGAGPAGLATALRLFRSKHDCEITMLEKDAVPGGLARSLRIAGSPADLGPHRIFTQIPEIQEFYQDFFGKGLFIVPRVSQMYFNGSYIDYPLKLSTALKKLGVFNTFRYGFSAFLASLKPVKKGKGNLSFDDVMKKAFGSAAYNDIIHPLAEKTWKINPSEIDPEVARVRVSAGGFKKLLRQVLGREKESDPSALREFHYLKGGFQEAVDRFVMGLRGWPIDIKTRIEIKDIQPFPKEGLLIQWKEADGRTIEDFFDFCFSTIPLDELIVFLSRHHHDDEALNTARKLKFVCTILFYIVVDKPRITPNTWLYFPDRSMLFNRGYETRNFNIMHPPASDSVMCLEVTAYQDHPLWRRTDEELTADVVSDIVSTGIFNKRNIIDTKVLRLTHAYPLLTKGYMDDLDVLWNYLAEMPSIITLGRQGLFQHNNMDHTIFTAFRAADLMINSNTPAQDWYTEEIQNFKDFKIID
jgi:protoporphyrinogen oxidase